MKNSVESVTLVQFTRKTWKCHSVGRRPPAPQTLLSLQAPLVSLLLSFPTNSPTNQREISVNIQNTQTKIRGFYVGCLSHNCLHQYLELVWFDLTDCDGVTKYVASRCGIGSSWNILLIGMRGRDTRTSMLLLSLLCTARDTCTAMLLLKLLWIVRDTYIAMLTFTAVRALLRALTLLCHAMLPTMFCLAPICPAMSSYRCSAAPSCWSEWASFWPVRWCGVHIEEHLLWPEKTLGRCRGRCIPSHKSW